MQPRLVETVLRLAILPGLVLGAGLMLGTGAGAGAGAADPVLARADQRIGAGDLKGAMMELRSGVTARPEAPDLRARLGLLYLELSDGAGAEKELQRAIELGKADFQLRLQLARARLLQGKAREVITDPGLDAAATPQDKAAARVLKGLARLDANEPAGAQTEFQAALTELPRYATAYLGLARVQLQASDLTGAQASLRDAAGGLEGHYRQCDRLSHHG